MPAKQCTICSHPRRQAAEALLEAGVSPRKTAGQLNISYPSLERHRTSCLVKSLQKTEEVKQPASLSDPQNELEKMHAQTLAILEAARKSNDHGLAIQTIQQANRNIELAARLSGLLKAGSATDSKTTLTLQMLKDLVEGSRK